MNGTRVYGATFRFRTQDGETVTAESFSTGAKWVKNQRVSVQYLPANPKIAKIEGGRRDVSSAMGLLVLLFPLAGFLRMFSTFWIRNRTLRIMTNGRLSDYEVISVVGTGASVNEQEIHKITLQSKDLLPVPSVVVKTHDAREIALALDRKQRQECVFGLANPRKPKRVILPEAWVIKGGQIQWKIQGVSH
jgi:hypothetical protein